MYTKNERCAVYEKLRRKYGIEMQFVVCMEECAELIKEISKQIRGKGKIESLIEEVADVRIICEELEYLFCIEEQVKDYIQRKISRTAKKLISTP